MMKSRLPFIDVLMHLHETKLAKKTIQLFLLAVVFMLPQSLSAFEECYYSRTDDGIIHYGVGVNGLLYEVHIDLDGSTYDEVYGYTDLKVEATLMCTLFSFNGNNEPIIYDEWNTDSVLNVESLCLDFEYFTGSIFPDMDEFIYYLYYREIPVTAIESGAFNGCNQIRDVRISPTVKRIGYRAFRNSSLRMLDLSDGYNEPIEIGDECCRDCKRLVEVRIDRAIDEIPYGMCLSCPSLTHANVYSKNTLTRIGALAFANCTSLPSFYVLKGTDEIGSGAFANCYALKMIWQPKSTNTAKIIGKYAFSNCYSLEYFNFNNVIQRIGEGAFINCRGLTYLAIPSTVTSISDYTFTGCTGLTDLRLHDALTTIGKRAFSACFALTNVDIPNSVTFIDEGAFNGGMSVYEPWNDQNLRDTTNLCIACSAESHEEYQGEMRIITIGESLDSLAQYAFSGIIPDTVICIANRPPRCGGNWIFSRQAYNNTVLLVPRVLVNSYADATGWKNFHHIQGIEVLGSGDLDGDGNINVSDVTDLIAIVLSGGEVPACADVNGDGHVDVSDITMLINMVLNR